MMKVIKFWTWMEPNEAATVIDFLSDLQQALCEQYGDEIDKMNEEFPPESPKFIQNEEEGEWFDDDIPF